MLSLAFPPFNLGFLALVAFAPWLASLANVSRKQATKTGALLGLWLYSTQLMWLFTLTYRWTGSWLLGLVPLLLAAILGAAYYGVLGAMLQGPMQRREYVWVILLYAGHEVFRSLVPGLAFPWFLISTPLWPYPALIQPAFFGTQFLVSAWVFGFSVLLAMFLLGEKWSAARRLVVGVGLFLLLSFTWYSREIPADKKTFMIGQPGVDMAFGRLEDKAQLPARLETILASASLVKPDLLVLPEGLADGGSELPPSISFSIPSDVNVIFGGRRGVGPVYQSAFLHEAGDKWSFADKKRLVVFGEYVPGREILPFLKSFRLPAGDLAASDKTAAVKLAGLTVGPLLCFEGLFSDIAQAQAQNGSQVLALMCIDDWYLGTSAPDQLRAGAVWRSVETGLPVLRSATMGISMATDARGNVVLELPLGQAQGAKVTVDVPTSPMQNPARMLFPWLAVLSWPAYWGWRRFRAKPSR